MARCVCACVVAWAGGAEAASLPASGVEVELNAARWRVSRGEGVDVIERVSPRRPAVRVQVTRVDGRGEVGCGALLGELARKTGGRVLSGEFAPRWHEAWVVFEGDAGVVGNVGCLDVGGGQMVVATVSSAGEGLADAREVFDALSDGALGPAEVGWGVEGLQLSSSVLGVWAPAVEPAGSDGVMGGVAVSAWAGGAGFGLRYGVDVSLAGGLGPGLYADVGGGGGVGLGVGPLEVSALLLLGADWLGSWGTGSLTLGFSGWGGARGQARVRAGALALDAWGAWALRWGGGSQVRAGLRGSVLGAPGEYGWGVGVEWREYEAGGMGLVTVGISY